MPESVSKIYFANGLAGKTQKANLDGTNQEDISTGDIFTHGISVDKINDKIYWTDETDGAIRKANLDGSNKETIVSGLGDTHRVKVDPSGGKIYWDEDFPTNYIKRSDLDGSNIKTLITTGMNQPFGMDLDLINNKIYWCDVALGTIKRSNLDGSSIETVITQGSPTDISLDVANSRFYWTDSIAQSIKRTNYGGTGTVTIKSGPEFNFIPGIKFDPSGNKIYYSHNTSGLIRVLDLDTSDLTTIIDGLNAPMAIDIFVVPEPIILSGNIPSFINGFSLINNDLNFFIKGSVFIENDINLFINGHGIAQDFCDFYIRGPLLSTDNLNFFVNGIGPVLFADNLNLFINGTGINQSIALFLKGPSELLEFNFIFNKFIANSANTPQLIGAFTIDANSVIIEIWDLKNNNQQLILSNSLCVKNNGILWTWNLNQMPLLSSGKNQFFYRITSDIGEFFDGEFTLGTPENNTWFMPRNKNSYIR